MNEHPENDVPVRLYHNEDGTKNPFDDDPYNIRRERKKRLEEEELPLPPTDKSRQRNKLILLCVVGAVLSYPFFPLLTKTAMNFGVPFLTPPTSVIFAQVFSLALIVLFVAKLIHYSIHIAGLESDRIQLKLLFFYIPFQILTLGSLAVPNKYIVITMMLLSLVPIILTLIHCNQSTKKLMLPLMGVLLLLTAANNLRTTVIEQDCPFEARSYVLTPHPIGRGSDELTFVTTDLDLYSYHIFTQKLTNEEEFYFAFHEYESDNNPFRVVEPNYHEEPDDIKNELGMLLGETVEKCDWTFDKQFFRDYNLIVYTTYPDGPVLDFKIASISQKPEGTKIVPEIAYPEKTGSGQQQVSEVVVSLIRVPKDAPVNVINLL